MIITILKICNMTTEWRLDLFTPVCLSVFTSFKIPVDGVAQWLERRSVFNWRTFPDLYAWSMVNMWPLCGYGVRYGSTNQANSAFHPFGVGKWVVIRVITWITGAETIKTAGRDYACGCLVVRLACVCVAVSVPWRERIRKKRTRPYLNGWTETANLRKRRTIFFT